MGIYDYVNLCANNSDRLEAFAPFIPAELTERLKNGSLLALGILLGDMPEGAAVFETHGGQAFLRSFYIYEYDRRHGAGSELLTELCRRLGALGGIYSLGACLPIQCDEGVRRFFEKNGFEFYSGESEQAAIPRSALSALSLQPAKVRCSSGADTDAALLRNLESKLRKREAYLLEGSLCDAPVIGGLCRYAVEKGEITAAAVITKAPDGFCLAYLFGENGAAVSSVLSEAREAVLAVMEEGDILHMQLVNESSVRLAHKLIDESMLSAKRLVRKSITEVEL